MRHVEKKGSISVSHVEMKGSILSSYKKKTLVQFCESCWKEVQFFKSSKNSSKIWVIFFRKILETSFFEKSFILWDIFLNYRRKSSILWVVLEKKFNSWSQFFFEKKVPFFESYFPKTQFFEAYREKQVLFFESYFFFKKKINFESYFKEGSILWVKLEKNQFFESCWKKNQFFESYWKISSVLEGQIF